MCEIIFQGSTIEEKLLSAEKMVRKYKFDTMTSLQGRLDFDEDFERLVKSRIYDSRRFSFAIVDINGLKQFNDNYGYLKGDEYIIEVANDIQSAFGKDAVVYRFGGDEFTILCSCFSLVKMKKTLNNIKKQDRFSVGVMSSEEMDWSIADCKSVFNFANALLIDNKTTFKEQNL